MMDHQLPVDPEILNALDRNDKRQRQAQQAISDIGGALGTLGMVLNQGVNDTNTGVLGSVAVALRKAAHRLEHGDLLTWGDIELVRSGNAAATPVVGPAA